ncbi:MAG: hypothetical protein A2293_11295 [Elusimicrobia bacterium RIFOXYB2_FULL_49_7]|nr:MAG: hypothetical protein A2293_11295 [Elusimicrobia bacterium RIFOXYB2_FULL_49_7]
MKQLPSIVILFSLFGFLSAQAPSGQPDVKVVEGQGISTTEPDAVTQAKRDAVEKGIGVMLISATETRNFMIQKDVILTKTMGSVKKYEIISKQKTPDNLWDIKIKAEVSLADIRADLAALKILLESMDKPRVMVLIQEMRKGEFKPTYNSAATAVMDFLTQKEFNLVDPAQIAAMMGKDDDYITKAASGDAVAAAKLGRDNGAEVILVGRATASLGADNPMLAGMKSGQADINITLIDCQNGKIIAAKNAHTAKPHISEETAMSNALIAVGAKIMDRELFEKIVSYWQNIVNNGMDLKVTVSGIDGFAKLKDIKAFIQNVSPNVIKVTQRTFGNGILELEVLFKGNSEAFCDYMDGKKTTGGLEVAVSDFTAGTVKLKLK